MKEEFDAFLGEHKDAYYKYLAHEESYIFRLNPRSWIVAAFVWRNTTQGYLFWLEIAERWDKELEAQNIICRNF